MDEKNIISNNYISVTCWQILYGEKKNCSLHKDNYKTSPIPFHFRNAFIQVIMHNCFKTTWYIKCCQYKVNQLIKCTEWEHLPKKQCCITVHQYPRYCFHRSCMTRNCQLMHSFHTPYLH